MKQPVLLVFTIVFFQKEKTQPRKLVNPGSRGKRGEEGR